MRHRVRWVCSSAATINCTFSRAEESDHARDTSPFGQRSRALENWPGSVRSSKHQQRSWRYVQAQYHTIVSLDVQCRWLHRPLCELLNLAYFTVDVFIEYLAEATYSKVCLSTSGLARELLVHSRVWFHWVCATSVFKGIVHESIVMFGQKIEFQQYHDVFLFFMFVKHWKIVLYSKAFQWYWECYYYYYCYYCYYTLVLLLQYTTATATNKY